MMKKLLTIIAIACTLSAVGQNVPNRDFEEWENEFLFETVQSWVTSAQEGNGDVTKSSDNHSGSYSVLLANNPDSSFAYFYMGQTGENGPDGGIPYTSKFDSVVFWYKCDMQPGDTATVMFGKYTPTDTMMITAPIGGTVSSWTRFSLGIDTMSQTEVFFGVISTNPFGGPGFDPNSWIMVDDVEFVYSGSPQPSALPNASFELWDSVNVFEPVGWNSMNFMSVITGDSMALQQTTDAYSGDYAMKVTTVLIDSSFKSGWVFNGNAPQGPEGFTGGFEYDAVPTSLSGYYKYEPVGTDTGMIIIVGTEYDPVGDSSIYAFMAVAILTQTSSYTAFNIPIFYDTSQYTVDTVNIIVVTSMLLFDNPDSTNVGTTVYLDQLWLDSKCAYADTTALFPFESTTIQYAPPNTPEYVADSTYVTYLWNTGETSFTVALPADTNDLSLTVTDMNDCEIYDEVTIYTIDTASIGMGEYGDLEMTVYPNPTEGNLYVSFGKDHDFSELHIYDGLGRSVGDYTITQKRELTIDTSTLDGGMYFMTLSGGGGVLVTHWLTVVK